MSDSANPADASDSRGEPGAWSRNEIEAAIAGLDRATRKFTSRVDALSGGASGFPAPAPPLPAPNLPPAPAAAAPPTAPAATPPHAPRPPIARSAPARSTPIYPRPERPTFDEQMREAEQAAREYLDRAKRRADTLVQTMIAAVEREAGEIRREAEEGIRERWSSVELEAGRYLDEARCAADGLVTEKREVLGELSDGIERRARSLTTGLEDAERVQAQFDNFVRRLSETSNRIAEEASERSSSEIADLNGRQEGLRDDALAA